MEVVIRVYTFWAILLALTSTVFALDYFDYSQEKKFEIPLREQSIIVTSEGYYPETLTIFEGEKIKLFVTSTVDKPSCLLIPEKELFMEANKGKVTEGEAYFAKEGTYEFHCPSGKIKGKIVVLKRQEKVNREVASEKKIIRVWRPKEE